MSCNTWQILNIKCHKGSVLKWKKKKVNLGKKWTHIPNQMRYSEESLKHMHFLNNQLGVQNRIIPTFTLDFHSMLGDKLRIVNA